MLGSVSGLRSVSGLAAGASSVTFPGTFDPVSNPVSAALIYGFRQNVWTSRDKPHKLSNVRDCKTNLDRVIDGIFGLDCIHTVGFTFGSVSSNRVQVKPSAVLF